jgi:hypothetical protein
MALHWLALRLSPECGYPKWIAFFMLPQNAFIFILFYDFYRKTYLKKVETAESRTKNDLNNNEDSDPVTKINDMGKAAVEEALLATESALHS